MLVFLRAPQAFDTFMVEPPYTQPQMTTENSHSDHIWTKIHGQVVKESIWCTVIFQKQLGLYLSLTPGNTIDDLAWWNGIAGGDDISTRMIVEIKKKDSGCLDRDSCCLSFLRITKRWITIRWMSPRRWAGFHYLHQCFPLHRVCRDISGIKSIIEYQVFALRNASAG